ncbi:MAG: hypothetical protein HZC28_15235 [Spirochaetes bacterium]|nr:hypothetical protein [Spirochaetota bacterium]
MNLNVSYTWESLTVFARGENLLWWQPYKDYSGVNSDAFGIYGGVMLRI